MLKTGGNGKIRAWVLAVCILATGLLASGCRTQPQESGGAQQEKALRYVNYGLEAPEKINPLRPESSADETLACYLVEGLMRVYQYKLRYGMADSYEISKDGCMYTFHLREDAYYSDGKRVCAQDFRRAFQRLLQKENYNTRVAIIKNAEEIYWGKKETEELGVTVLDEQTLQIELEHPMAQFLQILALRAFSPVREDAGDHLRPQDCNGPFVLAKSEEDNIFRMEKNPYYWEKESISLDAVEAVYLPDTGTAYEQFLKGNVDVMPVPIDGSQKYTGGELRRVMTGIYENLYLDLETEGPLQRKELRRALHYALDREAYKNALSSDSIEPNARCIPAVGQGICQTYVEAYPDKLFSVTGDLQLAKGYLGQALKALKLSGPEEIEITINVNDDAWSRKEAAELEKQWEEKLGIQITVKTYETPQLYENMKNGGMTLKGVIAEYSDLMAYLEAWGYDYAYGTQGSRSDEFLRYLEEASLQSDQQIRMNTLFEAEKILMEDVPMIPLQLRAERLLLNSELTGFETSMNLAGGGYEFLYANFE